MHDADGSTIKLPELRKGDTVRVTAVAMNGVGESEPVSASARVSNHPPRIHALQIHQRSEGEGGEEWYVEAEAEDPDGDSVRLRIRVADQRIQVWISRVTRSRRRRVKRGDRVQAQGHCHGWRRLGVSRPRPAPSRSRTPRPSIVSTPPRLDTRTASSSTT